MGRDAAPALRIPSRAINSCSERESRPRRTFPAPPPWPEESGQLVGLGVEVVVGQVRLGELDGDRVGGAGGLGLEQLRQGRGRHRGGGVVPGLDDGVPFLV